MMSSIFCICPNINQPVPHRMCLGVGYTSPAANEHVEPYTVVVYKTRRRKAHTALVLQTYYEWSQLMMTNQFEELSALKSQVAAPQCDNTDDEVAALKSQVATLELALELERTKPSNEVAHADRSQGSGGNGGKKPAKNQGSGWFNHSKFMLEAYKAYMSVIGSLCSIGCIVSSVTYWLLFRRGWGATGR